MPTNENLAPADASREKVSHALPHALLQALDNYRLLAFSEAPEDAKAFQQHQAACKAALQHLDALLKLMAGPAGDGKAMSSGDTQKLIARAEAAVDAYAIAENKTEETEL